MTSSEIVPLANLEYQSYLNENGLIDLELEKKIGVYAIFNQTKILQYIGYSRNIYLSLKQHLIRQIDQCYWLKIQLITTPSRTILEAIKNSWIEENGQINIQNAENEEKWTQPIDAKIGMSEQDKKNYDYSGEMEKIKFLKKIARNLESEINTKLQARNCKEEIRFNPKLKEQGLLDLK